MSENRPVPHRRRPHLGVSPSGYYAWVSGRLARPWTPRAAESGRRTPRRRHLGTRLQIDLRSRLGRRNVCPAELKAGGRREPSQSRHDRRMGAPGPDLVDRIHRGSAQGCGWPISRISNVAASSSGGGSSVQPPDRRLVDGDHLHSRWARRPQHGALAAAAERRDPPSDHAAVYLDRVGNDVERQACPSMGSVGDAYDNAMAELFATLECECSIGVASRRRPKRAWPSSNHRGLLRSAGDTHRSAICHPARRSQSSHRSEPVHTSSRRLAPVKSGLETSQQVAPPACRPSLTATRHDGLGNVQAGRKMLSAEPKDHSKERTEAVKPDTLIPNLTSPHHHSPGIVTLNEAWAGVVEDQPRSWVRSVSPSGAPFHSLGGHAPSYSGQV